MRCLGVFIYGEELALAQCKKTQKFLEEKRNKKETNPNGAYMFFSSGEKPNLSINAKRFCNKITACS